MTKSVLFIGISILSSFTLKAQHTSTIDSLKTVLKIAKETKVRVDVFILITEELWHSAPTQAILYSDSALQLAKTINYPKGLALALANKGVAYYTLGNYVDAEKYYKNSLATYSENDLSYDVNLLYINLLKKQSRYSELIDFVKSLVLENDFSTIDPSYSVILASTYIELGNVIEAEKYLQPILESSKYLNDKFFYAKARVLMFEYLLLKSDYDSAENMLLPVFSIYQNIDDKLSLAKTHISFGNLKLSMGDVKMAREMLTTALVIYDSSGYAFGIAEAQRNLGTFYSSISEYDLATQYLFDAQEIYQHQNNPNELAKTYNELSWIYIQQRSYETASKFIFKAIGLSEKIENMVTESSTYNMYGVLLRKRDSLPEAYKAYMKSYKLSLQVNNKQRMAAALFNMAVVMEKMDQNNPEILEKYLAAYELDKEIGNKLGIAISEYSLGESYLNLNQLQLAEHFLDISRIKLKSLKSKKELLQNYNISAMLYEKKGNYTLANQYYRMYIALNDTLTNDHVLNKIGELEVKFDLKNKEREIAFLNLENKTREQELKLQENTINNQRLLIGFVVVAVAFLILLLLLTYRLLAIRNRNNKNLKLLNMQVQEQNEEITAQSEELQEANDQINSMNQALENKVEIRTNELKHAYEELDTFFYRASHDFSGPLTTFMGLAGLAKSTISDDNALHLFEKVGETALKLDKMVNKLRSISLTGPIDLKTDSIDFENILHKVINRTLEQVHDKDIEITSQIDVSGPFRSYPELIEIIFENVVENCIAYNGNNTPFIKVEIRSLASGTFISFTDNGDGINKQHFKRVFDMYFRATEKSIGNGLGLYLVNKAVNKLGGKVDLDSTYGKGTTISIELPEIAGTS